MDLEKNRSGKENGNIRNEVGTAGTRNANERCGAGQILADPKERSGAMHAEKLGEGTSMTHPLPSAMGDWQATGARGAE